MVPKHELAERAVRKKGFLTFPSSVRSSLTGTNAAGGDRLARGGRRAAYMALPSHHSAHPSRRVQSCADRGGFPRHRYRQDGKESPRSAHTGLPGPLTAATGAHTQLQREQEGHRSSTGAAPGQTPSQQPEPRAPTRLPSQPSTCRVRHFKVSPPRPRERRFPSLTLFF